MVIGQKRNKILEEVQQVLTPTIDYLTREIEAIQNNKIVWHRHTSSVCGFDYGLIRFFYDEQYGYVEIVGKAYILRNFKLLKNYSISQHNDLSDEDVTKCSFSSLFRQSHVNSAFVKKSSGV